MSRRSCAAASRIPFSLTQPHAQSHTQATYVPPSGMSRDGSDSTAHRRRADGNALLCGDRGDLHGRVLPTTGETLPMKSLSLHLLSCIFHRGIQYLSLQYKAVSAGFSTRCAPQTRVCTCLRMPFHPIWQIWHPPTRVVISWYPPRHLQAQTREMLESRLTAAKLRRAKRKAREAVDAAGAGSGGCHRGGGNAGNSRASSATSVISSCHPSPAKQAVSGR